MLYDWPTWLIAVLLFAFMAVANEVGYRIGRREHESATELSRSVANALKGSVFGLVALLLAFSFSATTSRYEIRNRLVLDQANAIGTCYLRAGLLDETSKLRIQTTLREYLKARIEHYQSAQNDTEAHRLQQIIDRQLGELWNAVEGANLESPDAVRNSLIVPAVNDVIDLSSTRIWANRNQLPDLVLTLLLVCVIVSALMLGHSSGQSGNRHLGLWLASNLIFALVLFVVLDFDRPNRGLIRVDQAPLTDLSEQLKSP